MAWWNDMWKQLRSTWRSSFWYTRKTGVTGYASSCWPTMHQPIRSQAQHPPACCSRDSYVCPVTCCSGLLQTSLTIWQTLLIRCMRSIITLVNIWKWPATGWRSTMTTWRILQDSTKMTMSCSTARLDQVKSPNLQPWKDLYKVIT